MAGHGGVGLSVRVHAAGRGCRRRPPALLLHHGLASTQRIWDLMVPRLRRRFRVVTYDARGHGRSRKPTSGYGFDPVVADARDPRDRPPTSDRGRPFVGRVRGARARRPRAALRGWSRPRGRRSPLARDRWTGRPRSGSWPARPRGHAADGVPPGSPRSSTARSRSPRRSRRSSCPCCTSIAEDGSVRDCHAPTTCGSSGRSGSATQTKRSSVSRSGARGARPRRRRSWTERRTLIASRLRRTAAPVRLSSSAGSTTPSSTPAPSRSHRAFREQLVR